MLDARCDDANLLWSDGRILSRLQQLQDVVTHHLNSCHVVHQGRNTPRVARVSCSCAG
jgi:hypothetical protein